MTQACRLDRVDVLHVQYVGPLVTPPLVAMIHDLSYHHHPEWFTRNESLRLQLTVRWTARRAARILTASDFCRRDIITTLRVPDDKVRVSHHRVRSTFRERPQSEVNALLQTLGVRRPYVLTVGNLQPRKNLPRLIDAWRRLRAQHADFRPQLVIVGRKAWMFDDILSAARQETSSGDLVLTDYLPEADLPALYSGASVFVYPSLFEGFGLPPLEAMACGAPVIVSNTSSLPEACGDAAAYIDPSSVDDMASRMLELFRDSELQRTFREKGFHQARRFRRSNLMEVTTRAWEEAALLNETSLLKRHRQ
ncbi:MAG: glycosyltransferase family 4 protein [Vicinamibacterales bacterium]